MLQKLFQKVSDNFWKLLHNIFIIPYLDPTICKNKYDAKGKDAHKQCVTWKNKGYCKGQYKAFMEKNCEASCGLCTPKGKNVVKLISDTA